MSDAPILDEEEYLDRLLAMPEKERDRQIRTDTSEGVPAAIEPLVEAFVQEKAYEMINDDYAVLDVVREAVYYRRVEELYAQLEQRRAEKQAEAEEASETEGDEQP
jgi:hypothetical protein